MHLALCLYKYFPYGGLQRDMVDIARTLAARQHTVTIYCGSWRGARLDGVTIEILPPKGLTNHVRNRSFARQCAARIALHPPDLVLGFNKMAGLDVYYCADTCYATTVYTQKPALYRLTRRCRWLLADERAVFGTATHTEILLLSAREGAAVQHYYATPATRLHRLPPGTDKTRVRHTDSDAIGQAARQHLGLAQTATVLAFLGSNYRLKGLDRLLLAIAALPPKQLHTTRLCVIGEDKHIPRYRRLAVRLHLGDNVLFLGARDDIPALLFATDCLVHPAHLENTGTAILEAVVAGAPVLCTATCGFADYIRDHHLGHVIPEPFQQTVMNALLRELLHELPQIRPRCHAFAQTADIYSRSECTADWLEKIEHRRGRP